MASRIGARAGDQTFEGRPVEGRHLHAHHPVGADGGDVAAAPPQLDLAEVLALDHGRRDDLLAVRAGQNHLHSAARDEEELFRRRALLQDHRARRVLLRFEVARRLDQLRLIQGREGLGQVFLDDFAVGEDHGAGGPASQIAVVGHHQDGLALRHQRLEQAEDRFGGFGVEVAGRLIGREDRRIVGQRAGDGDALLLSARERRGQLVGLIGHADLLQQVQRPLAALARASTCGRSPSGSMTFSAAVSVGSSWKNWKTTPTLRPRHSASLPSLSVWMAVSPTRISPAVGRSMPVIMLTSVDLPLPDLPITATNSPQSTSRSTPFERGEIAGRAPIGFDKTMQLDEMIVAVVVVSVRFPVAVPVVRTVSAGLAS